MAVALFKMRRRPRPAVPPPWLAACRAANANDEFSGVGARREGKIMAAPLAWTVKSVSEDPNRNQDALEQC